MSDKSFLEQCRDINEKKEFRRQQAANVEYEEFIKKITIDIQNPNVIREHMANALEDGKTYIDYAISTGSGWLSTQVNPHQVSPQAFKNIFSLSREGGSYLQQLQTVVGPEFEVTLLDGGNMYWVRIALKKTNESSCILI